MDIPQNEQYFQRPRWILLSGWLSFLECDRVLAFLNEGEWRAGTYSDGTKRDNVNVQFHNTKETPIMQFLWDRIKQTASTTANILKVDINPEMHEFAQFSRWRKGDHYSMHTDNDASNRTLEYDRKVSLYCSLTDGGGLQLDKEGIVRCNKGDALIITGIMPHAAPVQEDGERISMVAWVLGPRWR